MKKLMIAAFSLVLTLGSFAATAAHAQSAPTFTPFICEPDGNYDGDAVSKWVTTPKGRTALKSGATMEPQGLDNGAGGLFGNFNNFGHFNTVSFSVKGTLDPTYGPFLYVTTIQDIYQQTWVKPVSAGTIGSTSKDGFTTISFTPAQMGIPYQNPYITRIWLEVFGNQTGFSVLMDDFTLNGQAATKVLQKPQHTCPNLPF